MRVDHRRELLHRCPAGAICHEGSQSGSQKYPCTTTHVVGMRFRRMHVRWQCPVVKPERGLLYARNMLYEDSCTNMQGKEVRVAHTGWRSLSGH